MRGEFYISQVVQWNSELRARVLKWFDTYGDIDAPTGWLLGVSTEDGWTWLAQRLGCRDDEVFRALKQRLWREEDVSSPAKTAGVSRSEIAVFYDDRFIEYLAQLLKCGLTRAAVIEAVFDREKLTTLLQQAGIVAKVRSEPLDELFMKMTTRAGLLRLHHFTVARQTCGWC